MDTAALILVIIVSVTLTIFLIASIVLITSVIVLIKKIKLVADKAETAVESITSAGAMLRDASGPLAVAKIIGKLVKRYKNAKD